MLSDNHNSDHYPVKVSWKQPPTLLSPIPSFKPSQAKWTEFTELTLFENTNIQQTPIDDHLRQIEQTIISAADNTIPNTSGHFSKPPVTWWNIACSAARQNRIRAERTFHRNPTLENRIAQNRTRAFTQYTLNTSRKQSFQSYVQSINQRCSLHSVWKKVRKIEGKFSPTPAPLLKDRNCVLHSSPQDCANIYAQHFATVSSSDNYTLRFQCYKTPCEQKSINFATQDQHDYNLPITINELQHTLSSVQKSSPGEEQITYSMLKHCHPSLLNTILCLFNRIFS